MPTYEYRCTNGHDFEEFFLKISAAKSELPCPTCGARGERRLSAGGGLLFKGSGFYITDYGKDGKKTQSAPKKDAGASSSGAAKSDAGKNEGSKPETAKAEAKPASAPPSTPSKGSE
jgi:putative FmdB family regulatory protein